VTSYARLHAEVKVVGTARVLQAVKTTDEWAKRITVQRAHDGIDVT